jgi:hypothetical protein
LEVSPVTTDSESVDSVPEDLDVRKPAVRVRRAGRGRSRRSLVATVELFAGISNASAEAFRSLNLALTPEGVAAAGFRASVLTGLRDGNARFFQELSHTSQRVFDALQAPKAAELEEVPDTNSLARRIDYERLARLVAVEMKEKPAHAERRNSPGGST